MICKFCGKVIPDDSVFCPECGQSLSSDEDQAAKSFSDVQSEQSSEFVVNQTVNANPVNDYQSASQDKTMGVVAYITWIGFIVAICSSSQKSEFTRFHLNQALVINIASMIAAFIPVIGFILCIVFFIAKIVGIVYAANGQMVEIPLIGQIKIIK